MASSIMLLWFAVKMKICRVYGAMLHYFYHFLRGGDMDMPACFQQSQLMTSTAWLTCGSAKEFKGRQEDSGSAARLLHSQMHAGAY